MTLADFVGQRVRSRNGANSLPYDIFSEIVTFAIPKFKFTSAEEASKAVIEELNKLNIEVGTQEVSMRNQWPSEERVVPFSKHDPGGLWAPMGTKASLQVGDYVAVHADTWREKFEGVVKNVKKDKVDVLDYATGVLYEDIPHELLSRPVAKGRPIAPPQYRRIGDPVGLMDSPRDQGDPNATRVYPGMYFCPRGQEGDSVVNPPNPFYSSLADDAKKYIEGKKVNLSSELISTLNSQGLLRLP